MKAIRRILASVGLIGAASVPAISPATAATPQTRLVIGLGDSITAGTVLPSTTLAWPDQVSLLSAGHFAVLNEGIASNALADVTAFLPSFYPTRPEVPSMQERVASL